MDRLESLGNTLSQITLYDIKTMYNQAKNVVLNVSEMEAKVRDATNDEAWGASSTLMQEIAQGTFNFQLFNEIMPCIYARFMEKEARQWRQIYKALQLLEYIIKHGSERVVDDARSHMSTIKMLRNFHYIDDKGKDQGVNVRNRSRELVELLSDLDRIRQERRKAKINRNKYTGTGNDGMSFSSGDARYGGFGNETGGSGYDGGSYDREYGSGGGGGGSSGGFRDDAGRKGYEEYDAGDWEDTPKRSNSLSQRQSTSAGGASGSRTSITARMSETTKPKAKEAPKVVDLLGFGDEEAAQLEKPLPKSAAPLDDDFDDFQSAPSAPAVATASPTVLPKPNVFDFLGSNQAAVPSAQPTIGSFNNVSATGTRPAYVGSFGTLSPTQTANYSSAPITPTSPLANQPISPGLSSRTASNKAASGTQKSVGNFDDLWSMSLGGGGSSSATKTTSGTGQKSIMELEKEKAQAGLWGSGQQQQQRMGMGGLSGSSLFNTTAPSASGGAGDDLLL